MGMRWLGATTAAIGLALALSLSGFGSAPAAHAVSKAKAKPKASISALSPRSGTVKGGTKVTVTGTGFTAVKKVTLGGRAVKKLKVVSSKKLTFLAPAHKAGAATLSITTSAGKTSKAAAFTYQTPLRRSGPVTVGSGKTVTGLRITSSSGPCVKVAPGATNVTISGNEIGPCGRAVDDVGVLVQAKASRVTISHNTIHNVSSGALAADANNPIVFSYNTVYDVRGPFPRGQMVQFAGVSGGAGQSKIIGNVSDKQRATITTTYEDHINLYKTTGSQAHPILIACNKIRGSATKNDRTSDGVTELDTSNGSGITVGDNGGGWVTIRKNVVLFTPNTGIGVAGGSHITVADNLIDNRGTAAASMTQEAVTVFPFRGYQPSAITITGNRGTARAWKYGSTGQLVFSYWADDAVTGVSLVNNRWEDTTLNPRTLWASRLTCP